MIPASGNPNLSADTSRTTPYHLLLSLCRNTAFQSCQGYSGSVPYCWRIHVNNSCRVTPSLPNYFMCDLCNNLLHEVLPQIPLRTALISEIIQRSIYLFQLINPAQIRFLFGCWSFLITANHFKPFLFRSEQTFHLNSEIWLVVGQSLHELHILVSGQEDLTDSLNILLLNTGCRHKLFRYVRFYICQYL